MDKRNKKILFELNKMCNSKYTVFEYDEIISKLPKKYEFDKDSLIHNLKFLEDRNYVDIKYFDDNVICICPLSKSHILQEDEIEEKKLKRIKINYLFICALMSAVFAFLGAFIAVYLFK